MNSDPDLLTPKNLYKSNVGSDPANCSNIRPLSIKQFQQFNKKSKNCMTKICKRCDSIKNNSNALGIQYVSKEKALIILQLHYYLTQYVYTHTLHNALENLIRMEKKYIMEIIDQQCINMQEAVYHINRTSLHNHPPNYYINETLESTGKNSTNSYTINQQNNPAVIFSSYSGLTAANPQVNFNENLSVSAVSNVRKENLFDNSWSDIDNVSSYCQEYKLINPGEQCQYSNIRPKW